VGLGVAYTSCMGIADRIVAVNKYLAQRNKSRSGGEATKRRGRASAYRDVIPASVFGRLYAWNKIGI
jgi:hypothetical protein